VVETLSDDVGQAIVEGQVQRNFGILREKSRNSRAEKKIRRITRKKLINVALCLVFPLR
jgi:hypothetical protein